MSEIYYRGIEIEIRELMAVRSTKGWSVLSQRGFVEASCKFGDAFAPDAGGAVDMLKDLIDENLDEGPRAA